jgi:solute carrier family 34 (sodium-dependent phosphate cotransporter)
MAITPSAEIPISPSPQRWKIYLRNTAYIVAALLIFLFSIDLMISALQHLGKAVSDVIILATANPFTGLFIGLLVTAIIQSSSATTSMVVALVATGSISLQGAVPIIMGANVGTTITSTIVSLSFITKKKEFRRAVTAGTYHDFFNILTVVILFPLEYYFGFLSGLSQAMANFFFVQPKEPTVTHFSLLGNLFDPFIQFLIRTINYDFLLVIIAIILLFGSILFFRKIITNILGLASSERFQQFFFKNTLKSFGWGLLTTAAIRSSTVTTSLVVPLVAKKVVKMKAATPFILGANIGTTITAFIASSFNSNAAISIALAHFLFNLIGVLIFLPIPYVKDIPLKLANGLGRLTLRYRLVGFSYLLMTFFFVPFALIFLSKNMVQVEEATYQKIDADGKQTNYSILVRKYEGNQFSNWTAEARETAEASIVSIYRKKNILIIGNDLFELNKPGFCRDGEDENGKYRICIREILPSLALLAGMEAKSVYVFEKQSYVPARIDSVTVWSYVSASENLLVKKEIQDKHGRVLMKDELIKLEKK